MPTVYSHSRLSTFEECRLRYRLRYIERVRRDLDGVESFLGSRVHEALEGLYRDVMMGRVPAADALAAGFHRRWEEEWHDGVVVRSERYAAADYRAAGEECLRRYHARHAPFRGDQTLGVEVRIALELPGGARLEGFADRVARDPDGWLAVHDYKTSGSLPTQADLDQDRQLALYQAAVETMWPGAPGVRLVWHFLRFDERLVSTRTREQIAALLRDTAARVREVEEEREWRPTASALCGWCPYWDLCPEKRHDWLAGRAPWKGPPGSGGPLAGTLFEGHEGRDRDGAAAAEAALADAVAALRRRREAEADLAEARARLLAWARVAEAHRITGPAGSARVRLGERPDLPAKSEEGHERLRAALIAAGRYEAFAELTPAARGRLLAALEEGSLPAELAEAVGRLVTRRTVEGVTIYPGREEEERETGDGSRATDRGEDREGEAGA